MADLSLSSVSKRFGETVAVDNVSIDVADGEFVVLVGPSGCGKTTTLRILAGLEAASAGRVAIDGRDVTHTKAKDRNLAMVFQSYALYPHMSVGETIGFSLRLQGMSRARIEEAVRAAAERLDIAHLLHRKPRELSGGQRQRVAVARCIVRRPHAFLFDEPLSNLDAKLRSSARVEIAKLQKSLGITSVYVTHDQVEAMTMADRIVLMDEGRIRQEGPPMTLYQDPADTFVATFLGAPSMNLIPAPVVQTPQGPCAQVDILSLPLPAAATGTVTLGVRPEALAPDPSGDITIKGWVDHVEELGAETIVAVVPTTIAVPKIMVRMAGGTARARPGESVVLSCSAQSIYIFGEDGQRLRQAL
ncbi:MAG: ABC transporter ATP-binding protein [Pseudomonadota bacterium]